MGTSPEDIEAFLAKTTPEQFKRMSREEQRIYLARIEFLKGYALEQMQLTSQEIERQEKEAKNSLQAKLWRLWLRLTNNQ